MHRPARGTCAHGAEGGAGKGEGRRLVVEAHHAHDHRPEPVGLAQGDGDLGRGRLGLGREHAGAAAQDRRPAPTWCPAASPGCRPERRAGGGTSRPPMMKCAALSAASASMEPASTMGLVGHDGHRVAAEAGQADRSPPGRSRAGPRTSSPSSTTTSMTVAHVVDPAAAAGHDRQAARATAGTRRRPLAVARVGPGAGRESSTGSGRTWSSARRSRRGRRCGPARWPRPRRARPGPPWSPARPSDSRTTGRPGGEDGRLVAHHA